MCSQLLLFCLLTVVDMKAEENTKFEYKKCNVFPTHSRLERNVADWHKNYDAYFKVTDDGPLSAKQINQYYQNGFIVINDIIPINMINDCLSDIDTLIDKITNTLYNNSLIHDLCLNYTVFNRSICVDNQFKSSHILYHKYAELYQSFINIWQYESLTDIAIQLLQPPSDNPSIDAHPSWNLRAKLPFNEESDVPWHQDIAYFDKSNRNIHQLTVWIPFVDIDIIHGPIQLIRKGHIPGNVATHTCCHRNTRFISLSNKTIENEIIKYIPNINIENNSTLVDDFIQTITMNKGSVLLFSNIMPHRAIENLSDMVRWSLDLRFQVNGVPNGLDHIKRNLKIRDFTNKSFIPDWSEWSRIDRVKLQFGDEDNDKFTIYTGGPWMDYWEVINQNNHTKAYFHGST